MRFRIFLLAVLSLTFQSNAYALSDIERCRHYLNSPLKALEELKEKLPDVPIESNEYFRDRFKDLGLPKFYRLKSQPHFFTWTLKNALEIAESKLRWNAKEASFENAHSAIVFSLYLPILLSDVRNAWTEYVAYIDDDRFNDRQKDEISDSLFGANVAFSIYVSCLVQKL